MFRTLVVLVGTAISASATTTVYTDLSSWTAAMDQLPGANLVEETFAGDQINTPGFSFTTVSGPGGTLPGFGSVQNDAWTDSVGQPNNATTTMRYNSDLYGIFGTWKISSSALGLNIYLSDNGNLLGELIPNQPNKVWGGYLPLTGTWGFVSDQPINGLLFGSDKGMVNFTLSDLWLGDPSTPDATATPEPAAFGFAALGLFGLSVFGIRRKRS